MNEEKKYTKKEWEQMERDDNLVRAVRHALTGKRIESRDVYDRIIAQIKAITQLERA